MIRRPLIKSHEPCPGFRQSYSWHLICPENLFYLQFDCSNKHFKMKYKLFSLSILTGCCEIKQIIT